MAAVSSTTTTSDWAATDHHGRRPNHHGFGQRRDCRSRPSVQPPRLRPVPWPPITAVRPTTTTSALPSLTMAAVHPTTTASACGATARSGRLRNRHDFGLCGNAHCSRQAARASACAAIDHSIRLCDHRDFEWTGEAGAQFGFVGSAVNVEFTLRRASGDSVQLMFRPGRLLLTPLLPRRQLSNLHLQFRAARQ